MCEDMRTLCARRFGDGASVIGPHEHGSAALRLLPLLCLAGGFSPTHSLTKVPVSTPLAQEAPALLSGMTTCSRGAAEYIYREKEKGKIRGTLPKKPASKKKEKEVGWFVFVCKIR